MCSLSSLRFRSVEGDGVAGHGDAAANELHLGIAEQPVVPPAEVVPGLDPERAVVLFARPARELSGTLYQAWAAASLPTQLDCQLIASEAMDGVACADRDLRERFRDRDAHE